MNATTCLCEEPPTGGEKLVLISCATACVLMAGLVSGLTLGLMSIDATDLEVLKRAGSEREKKYAKKIEPLLARPHLLLVTLLVCNALCAEALPIFLDRLLDPLTAVVLSVTVVLLFGEIIPQAFCARFGLAIGAYSSWLVRVLIVVCWVIAYPISKVLDWLLGHNQAALFRRPQLKALVDIQAEVTNITNQEAHIIAGALDLATKTAKSAMTPLDKVFSLPDNAVLDEHTLERVLESGHSRVPIHRAGNKQHFIGLLLVKELVLLDPEDCVPITQAALRPVPYVSATLAMYDLLTLFATGRSHMVALVDTAPVREGGETLDISTRIANITTNDDLSAPLLTEQPQSNIDQQSTMVDAGTESYIPPCFSAFSNATASPTDTPAAAADNDHVEQQKQQQEEYMHNHPVEQNPPAASPPTDAPSQYEFADHVKACLAEQVTRYGSCGVSDVMSEPPPSLLTNLNTMDGGQTGQEPSHHDHEGNTGGAHEEGGPSTQQVGPRSVSGSPVNTTNAHTNARVRFRSAERLSWQRSSLSVDAAAGGVEVSEGSKRKAAFKSIPSALRVTEPTATPPTDDAPVQPRSPSPAPPPHPQTDPLPITSTAAPALTDERRLYKSKTAMLQTKAREGHREGYRTIGIITIEDVIEELLQYEILDETDRYVDNLRTEKVVVGDVLRSLPPHLQRLLDDKTLHPLLLSKVASASRHTQLSSVKVDRPAAGQ